MTRAQIAKASEDEREKYGEYDFTIKLHRELWALKSFKDQDREMDLFHELLHAQAEIDDSTSEQKVDERDRLCWRVRRRHPIQEFPEVIERYGLERATGMNAAALAALDDEEAKREAEADANDSQRPLLRQAEDGGTPTLHEAGKPIEALGISAPRCEKLHAAGIGTVGELRALMQEDPRGWFQPIKGIGRRWGGTRIDRSPKEPQGITQATPGGAGTIQGPPLGTGSPGETREDQQHEAAWPAYAPSRLARLVQFRVSQIQNQGRPRGGGGGVRVNTSQLKEAMRSHYSGNAYALLWEVGNGTGMNFSRHCDALAMSLWPSRGLDLIGCEMKVSRGDWLKELKNPEKAEAVYQFCDMWFIVAGDAEIVRDGELPQGWGLMVPTKTGGLRVASPAARLSPVPVDRSFLAAIMRRVVEQGIDAAILKKAGDDGYKRGYESAERSWKHRQDEELSLRKRVEEFEAASGVKIAGWGGPKNIGRAVKAIISGELVNNGGLTAARNLAAAFVRNVDEMQQANKGAAASVGDNAAAAAQAGEE